VPDQGQCRLMVKVLPLAAHLLLRLGEQAHRLAASVAAFLATGDTTLRCLECAFGFAIPARREDASSIEEGGERLNPRSIPVSCPVGGRDWSGTSVQDTATYQPSASREIVMVLGVPCIGRLQ
jgi:hypothetical protein